MAPLATPDDVRGEIDTELEDSDIQFYLDDAAFINDQNNDTGTQADAVRKRIERKIAAIKVLEGKEREAESEQVGSVRVSHGASVIDRLKSEVADLDASGDIYPQHDVPLGSYEVY